MDTLFTSYFTWFDLLIAALILYGLYALLLLIRDRLELTKRVEGFRAAVYSVVSPFLLLYEPITVVVVLTIFLFIDPVIHGAVLLLVIAAGFSRIRDYLSGRIVLFNPLITVGKRMKTDRFNGVISRISRIGVYLQTGEGLHFVNFSTLLTHGYSLVTGKDIGGYYQLRLTPPEGSSQPLTDLFDRLTTTPYLDRGFRPELSLSEKEPERILARLSVREEKHLTELLALLKEWGYPATIAKR